MKSPVVVYKVSAKGLAPHDHPALKGKEFANGNEAIIAVQDYTAANPGEPKPEGCVFVQFYDFTN